MPTSEPPSVAALIGLAAAIGVASASLCAYLILWRRDKLRQRGEIVGVFSAGILVGLALLSMLPDAMDTLRTDFEWHTVSVMIVFMITGAGMFFLEHVVFTHEHYIANGMLPERDNISGAAAAAATPAADVVKVDAATAEAPASEPISEIELQCTPCDDDDDNEVVAPAPAAAEPAPPPPRNVSEAMEAGSAKPAPALSYKGPQTRARFRVGRRRSAGTNWWELGDDNCECCEDGQGGGSNHVPAPAEDAAATSSDGAPSSRSLMLLLAAALRQVAWILHAVIDGMVVGSVPTVALLVPAGFAVLVCAMQDALAYAVFLSRCRAPKRVVKAALVLFSVAFPLGASVAAILQRQLHGGGREALSVMRVAMAAIFCYMATELAPRHTHSKLVNLMHATVFALGVGAAGSAELFEGLATGE